MSNAPPAACTLRKGIPLTVLITIQKCSFVCVDRLPGPLPHPAASHTPTSHTLLCHTPLCHTPPVSHTPLCHTPALQWVNPHLLRC